MLMANVRSWLIILVGVDHVVNQSEQWVAWFMIWNDNRKSQALVRASQWRAFDYTYFGRAITLRTLEDAGIAGR